MLQADPPPRLPPIGDAQMTDETRRFLSRWTGGFFKDADQHPVLRTFGHHPRLADLFSQLNVHLLTTNTLPVKQRQIAIMRAAWITKATFMWSSHLNTSVVAGCDPAMFEPLKHGAQDPYFTPFEGAVIRATEELVENRDIRDADWNVLMGEWSEQQMLDFLFTVGAYVTIAGVMRAARVQRMPELLELAERYGQPE